MGLIEKLETLLNALLIKLGELIWRFVPAPVKKFQKKLQAWRARFILFLKQLPSLAKTFITTVVANAKGAATTIDFKAIFFDSYKKAMAQYKEKSTGTIGAMKKIALMPFLVIAQWVQGLTAAQALMLLSFTGASILAVIGIGFSGHKLAKSHMGDGRSPASVEEEILYERPDYYKKQTKHLDVTNFRLPVYVAQVNEIRSVDIDFTATLSNRHSKMYLEKREFQLRDHLINNIEPSVATFPLEEEGKEIIRKKIWMELNEYLKQNGIEGEVIELKITYVLAN